MKILPHLTQMEPSGVHAKCEMRSLLVLLTTTPPWMQAKVLSHTQFQTSILQQMDSQTRLLLPPLVTPRMFLATGHYACLFFLQCPLTQPLPLHNVCYHFKAFLKNFPLLLLSPQLSSLSLVTSIQWVFKMFIENEDYEKHYTDFISSCTKLICLCCVPFTK